MKRDWDLVRHILLKLEEQATVQSKLLPADLPAFDEETVSYHFRLLDDAGLITAKCIGGGKRLHCVATGMTWAGHEFLDSVRTVTLWNRTKELVREKGLELSFDAVKAAAKVIVETFMKS